MTNEEIMLDALGRVAGLLKDVKRPSKEVCAAYALAYDTIAKVGIRTYPNRDGVIGKIQETETTK